MHIVGKSVRSQFHSVPGFQSIVKKAVVEAMKRKYNRTIFSEDGPVYKIEIAILKDSATLAGSAGLYSAACQNSRRIRLAKEYTAEIHLLITDVVMPEMNGKELTKLVSGIRPGIKCLFASGYTANIIAHRGVLEDGVNFIQKLFSMQNLAEKVREVLNC